MNILAALSRQKLLIVTFIVVVIILGVGAAVAKSLQLTSILPGSLAQTKQAVVLDPVEVTLNTSQTVDDKMQFSFTLTKPPQQALSGLSIRLVTDSTLVAEKFVFEMNPQLRELGWQSLVTSVTERPESPYEFYIDMALVRISPEPAMLDAGTFFGSFTLQQPVPASIELVSDPELTTAITQDNTELPLEVTRGN